MEKKILLVDDEEIVLKMLEHVLGSQGYKTFATTNGEKALQIAKDEDIRFLITDLRMPGMDGMELCRRMKEQDPDSIVYALSAYVSAYSEAQFEAVGFDGHIEKPFSMDKLMKACGDAFAESE